LTTRRRSFSLFPYTTRFRSGVLLYVLHDVKELGLDPRAAGFGAVISGHSHQPRQEERDGVLFFNPGSAGPRRFKLPVALGRLSVDRKSTRLNSSHGSISYAV